VACCMPRSLLGTESSLACSRRSAGLPMQGRRESARVRRDTAGAQSPPSRHDSRAGPHRHRPSSCPRTNKEKPFVFCRPFVSIFAPPPDVERERTGWEPSQVIDKMSKMRVRASPALDLPPPFRAVALREAGDAFAHATRIATEAGAGTLVHVGRFDLAEFAVVL